MGEGVGERDSRMVVGETDEIDAWEIVQVYGWVCTSRTGYLFFLLSVSWIEARCDEEASYSWSKMHMVARMEEILWSR